MLFPKLSNESDERIHSLTADLCRHTLFITILAMGAVIVAGIVGIPLLYGADYATAIAPLIVLGPGGVAMGLYKVLTRNFSSRNRQQVSVLVVSAGLIINVALDVLLIPRLAIVGAALASSCAYGVMGLALLLFFRHESRLSWREILRPRRDDLVRYQLVVQHVWSVIRHGREWSLTPNGMGESAELGGDV